MCAYEKSNVSLCITVNKEIETSWNKGHGILATVASLSTFILHLLHERFLQAEMWQSCNTYTLHLH